MEIKKTMTLDASPDAVFKAVTRLEVLSSWLPDQELINWFPDKALFQDNIDRKKGLDCFKKELGRDDVQLPRGSIIELIPNKEISYTWEEFMEGDISSRVITWTLEKIDNLWCTYCGLELEIIAWLKCMRKYGLPSWIDW